MSSESAVKSPGVVDALIQNHSMPQVAVNNIAPYVASLDGEVNICLANVSGFNGFLKISKP